VVQDVPKPMAAIDGKPFLHYVFEYLVKYDVKEVVLSVGHLHEIIEDYFGQNYLGITIRYCLEDKPLGTGGAIKKAFEFVPGDAFVLNGDTFFDVDLHAFYRFHSAMQSDFSLSLKQLEDFDRYGTIELNGTRVVEFKEKEFKKSGLINGGVYITSKSVFDSFNAPENFSIEKDFLERNLKQLNVQGLRSNGYFIDIGIPEDYYKANKEMPQLFMK